MGGTTGPNIPQDGLQCMLDVGNLRGGFMGTTLSDVSGMGFSNNRDFTEASNPASNLSFNASQYASDYTQTYDRSINMPTNGMFGPASDSFGITSSTGASFVVVMKQHSLHSKMAFQFYMGDGAGNDARGYFTHLTWGNGYAYFDTNGSTSTSSGGGRLNTAGSHFVDEGWQMWTFTKSANGATMKIYKDAVEVASRTNAGACPTLSDDLATIGVNDTYNAWDADLGIFMCYNRELSSAEVQKICDGIKGPEAGFGRYYSA